jgi:flavin-dependent dehydrogenase
VKNVPKTKLICGCCGAEIDVEHTRTTSGLPDRWRECTRPLGRSWKFPTAKKELTDGVVVYLDKDKKEYTREEFIDRFGVDPERAVSYMVFNTRVRDAK